MASCRLKRFVRHYINDRFPGGMQWQLSLKKKDTDHVIFIA